MSPFLVEYGGDDDTGGCGLGAIVLMVVLGAGLVLFRLALGRNRR
jgi:hypothetical protein